MSDLRELTIDFRGSPTVIVYKHIVGDDEPDDATWWFKCPRGNGTRCDEVGYECDCQPETTEVENLSVMADIAVDIQNREPPH